MPVTGAICVNIADQSPCSYSISYWGRDEDIKSNICVMLYGDNCSGEQ